MPVLLCLIALLATALPARADTVYATRTLRPEEVLAPGDVVLRGGVVPGTYAALDEVLGQEARVALYAGRPIRRGDVRPPALVQRNMLVELVFDSGGLEILTEGRALDRGAAGDVIAVMNAGSRTRVFGVVRPDGRVQVE